jgi:hypothetical protein
MKNLLTLIGVLLISLTSFGQITLNQSIVKPGPYKVGDTITVKYTVNKDTATPRYFWFRYTYNTSALTYVPNSTVFSQGTSVQTYYTGWNNFVYTPPVNTVKTALYEQYKLSPWSFTTAADWNVGQLTVQRTDAAIDGVFATQKYILKDSYVYDGVFKLAMAYAINTNGTYASSITGNSDLSFGIVTGNTSQFKVKVAYPSGYDITKHNVQLMKLKSDNTIDWTQAPVAQKALDATGEVIFTTEVKVGDSVGVFVAPTMQKSFMNDIVTVSDAYKAFLGVTQTDITGASTFFTRPSLEKKIALITKGKTEFSEADSYNLFAHVMGIKMDSVATIPSSTSTSVRWYSGLLNQSWLDGTPTNKVKIVSPNQTANAVYAWGGDLDWSHSTDPSIIANSIDSGIYTNSINSSLSIKNMSTNAVGVYATKELEQAKLSVISTLENGKVVLTTTLTKADLAGLQIIMNYDDSKLTLDNVIFDAGSTITNFSTHKDGRLTFGSIDQLKTARIKVGTPYKLIFTPKSTLTNTAGLFYFILSDAVDAKGNKINLIVE